MLKKEESKRLQDQEFKIELFKKQTTLYEKLVLIQSITFMKELTIKVVQNLVEKEVNKRRNREWHYEKTIKAIKTIIKAWKNYVKLRLRFKILLALKESKRRKLVHSQRDEMAFQRRIAIRRIEENETKETILSKIIIPKREEFNNNTDDSIESNVNIQRKELTIYSEDLQNLIAGLNVQSHQFGQKWIEESINVTSLQDHIKKLKFGSSINDEKSTNNMINSLFKKLEKDRLDKLKRKYN